MEKNKGYIRAIVLKVNGEEHSVAVKDGETLLDVLRGKLRLTGTKKGCNLGVCGACTVLVDGDPKNSCLVLASSCEGAEITTIEGMAREGMLHPLQRAFINHGAIQCGFCTSGMVMTAMALIKRNPDPTKEEIKEALSGNLCRCTGYARIIEAIANWKRYIEEKELSYHSYDLDQSTAVGRSIPRKDAAAKVTGQAKFTADYYFENMLYGKNPSFPDCSRPDKKNGYYPSREASGR